MAFKIIRNDITKVHADAIVNTANPRPTAGRGTDFDIYKAAGYEKLLGVYEELQYHVLFRKGAKGSLS
ncbi:MAG: hypothetical protein II461_04605 [Treponema sp.]|nr:hypothetical protein [Treponema sp.]